MYWSLGAMLVTVAEEFRLHGGGSAESRYREAKAWLDERLAISPDNTAHWTWLAWALTGLHQPDSAERVWRRVDQVDPARASNRGRLAALAGAAVLPAADPRWQRGQARAAGAA